MSRATRRYRTLWPSLRPASVLPREPGRDQSELKKIFHFILNKKQNRQNSWKSRKQCHRDSKISQKSSHRAWGPTEPRPWARGGQAQLGCAPWGAPDPQEPGSGPQQLGGASSSSGSLHPGALAATAACGPHAPPGVVVMVEVPQAQPLHLQPRLQDPGWRRVSGLGDWGWAGLS